MQSKKPFYSRNKQTGGLALAKSFWNGHCQEVVARTGTISLQTNNLITLSSQSHKMMFLTIHTNAAGFQSRTETKNRTTMYQLPSSICRPLPLQQSCKPHKETDLLKDSPTNTPQVSSVNLCLELKHAGALLLQKQTTVANL